MSHDTCPAPGLRPALPNPAGRAGGPTGSRPPRTATGRPRATTLRALPGRPRQSFTANVLKAVSRAFLALLLRPGARLARDHDGVAVLVVGPEAAVEDAHLLAALPAGERPVRDGRVAPPLHGLDADQVVVLAGVADAGLQAAPGGRRVRAGLGVVVDLDTRETAGGAVYGARALARRTGLLEALGHRHGEVEPAVGDRDEAFRQRLVAVRGGTRLLRRRRAGLSSFAASSLGFGVSRRSPRRASPCSPPWPRTPCRPWPAPLAPFFSSPPPSAKARIVPSTARTTTTAPMIRVRRGTTSVTDGRAEPGRSASPGLDSGRAVAVAEAAALRTDCSAPRIRSFAASVSKPVRLASAPPAAFCSLPAAGRGRPALALAGVRSGASASAALSGRPGAGRGRCGCHSRSRLRASPWACAASAAWARLGLRLRRPGGGLRLLCGRRRQRHRARRVHGRFRLRLRGVRDGQQHRPRARVVQPARGVLHQQAEDDLFQRTGVLRRLDRLGHHRRQGRDGRTLVVRRHALDACVQQSAERPHVGRRARLLAAGPLRGDVGRRADEHAGGGDGGIPLDLGDAEVGQHDPAVVRHQDVGRLHIAVQDALAVGGTQHVQHGHAHLGGAARGERAVVADDLGERAALDQLHHDPGAVVLVDHVVDRHGSVVADPGNGLRLAQRAGDQTTLLVLLHPAGEAQLLDRDRTAQHLVACPPDRAHTAPAENIGEPVPAGEQPALLAVHLDLVAH